MVDENVFLETVHAVDEIVKTAAKPLSKEEILSYFSDMELSREQEEQVYRYFLKGLQADTPAEETEDVREPEAELDAEEAKKQFLESPYVKMYLEEMEGICRLSQEELEPYYKGLLQGDERASAVVTENYLQRVVDLAQRYVMLNVNMEDVLQEGNMALWMTVRQLLGSREKIDVEQALEDAVTAAMEAFIDDTLEDDNWENAVVGRARLLKEAQEVLAKELSRMPTMDELSEYTHLTKDEISDIMVLIKEKKPQ